MIYTNTNKYFMEFTFGIGTIKNDGYDHIQFINEKHMVQVKYLYIEHLPTKNYPNNVMLDNLVKFVKTQSRVLDMLS
jgi:hypothetical protein